MNIETTVRDHLRSNDSAQEAIDWDEIVLRLETDVVAAPRRPLRTRRVLAVASGALLVALLGLISFLVPEGDDAPPATDPVSPSTTVAPPSTTPAAEESEAEPAPPVVGDDRIVLAMAQAFPLVTDPRSWWTDGPDEESGQTAGITLFGETTDPDVDENHRDFGVDFIAFKSEQLASEFIGDMLIQDPTIPLLIVETFMYPDLGDEAAAIFGVYHSRSMRWGVSVAVRQGRFVAAVDSGIAPGLDTETVEDLFDPATVEDTLNRFDAGDYPAIGETVERLVRIAETANATMQTVLSSDVQALPAPQRETLTSYRIEVSVYPDSAVPTQVESIVTPEGYGCLFTLDQDAWPGVGEIGGTAVERIDWNEGWFTSTLDRPQFQTGQDLCRTWSPHLEESYLGNLTSLQEGHVGIDQGRQTLSYWFTKNDLIDAGVLTASDDIEIHDFQMIVDRAGPWLVGLWVSLEGDTAAIGKVTRLDLPHLEAATDRTQFSIDIDYGIIDEGTETWTDRLEEMLQPRS